MDEIKNKPRLATDEDVDNLCRLIAAAKNIEDIPVAPANVYFTPNQIHFKIERTGNPFVTKLHDLVRALMKNSHAACLMLDRPADGMI